MNKEKLEQAICQLCGEPMPKGEEMFNYHGYSGGCPKPPKAKEAKDDYIPFGDEWKKEINQFPKPALIDCVATMLSDKTADNQRLREAYNELIMAVGDKYPNESRHETALRYIREAELNRGVGSSALGGE